MSYQCFKVQKPQIDQILAQWMPLLSKDRQATLEAELSLSRPLYVAQRVPENEGDDPMPLAIFDIFASSTQNKNLRVFYSPAIVGDEGFTPEDVRRLTRLLSHIFSFMVITTDNSSVTTLKVYTEDAFLYLTFNGFSDFLAQNGLCDVKTYGHWIQIDNLDLSRFNDITDAVSST